MNRVFAIVIIIVVTAAIPTSSAEDNTAREALSGRELASFLGPVSPTLITWYKHIDRDAEVYEGTANPPLSGIVDISIFLPPWEPDLGLMPSPDGPDRLGVLHGTWSRDVYDGVYLVGFGFADRKDRFLHININSPKQSDADQIAEEVSRLPMFNLTPETPFHPLEIRKQARRAVVWLLLPVLFLLTLWLPDHHLRRRRVSRLRRILTAIVVSVIWILALPAVILFAQPFSTVRDFVRSPESLLVPALASILLITGIVALVVMLVRKQWRPSTA
jgi:hypothetical protein